MFPAAVFICGVISMYNFSIFSKFNRILISLFVAVFFIIGLPQMSCPQMMPPETVDYVDVERFTGLWYQIARYYNPAEGDLAAVTAEYSLNDDGTVKVVNRGLVGDLDGSPVSIEGFARVVDTETNAKLAVKFTDPAVGEEFEFWIIELGEYYSYAVISNSMRSTLYIISRTPTMEESIYQEIIDSLTMKGFDPEEIVLTPQIDEMPPPETVDFVDIERYAGLWYEIARYPVPFDEDGVAVTAEYTLNEDGTVGILNSSLVGDLDGPPNSIEGVARVVDEETNAKLAITFDRPELQGIEFPYWIIELDEDYQWAVVTNDTRFVLYILSRTPTMDDAVYEDILYRVVKKGFDADRLELTPQLEDCSIDVLQDTVLRSRWLPSVALITITGTDTDWVGGLVSDNFEITYTAEQSRELFWLPGTFPFLNEGTQTINQLIILLPAWFTACCFDGAVEIMTVEVCNTQTECCAEDEVAITMLPLGLAQ
jgi:apolipoprotein D and lipocalin family protein